MKQTHQKIYDLAAKLYPIHRSLTGDGVRQTLKIIKELLPNLEIKGAPSGTPCFDWNVPNYKESWGFCITDNQDTRSNSPKFLYT